MKIDREQQSEHQKYDFYIKIGNVISTIGARRIKTSP